MANIDDSAYEQHKELSSAQKKQSETLVRKAIQAFSAYINPFDGDISDLVSLASGRKVDGVLTEKILETDQQGELKVLERAFGSSAVRKVEMLEVKWRFWNVSECVFWDMRHDKSRSVRRV